jgi:hypothetical protein
MTVEARLIQDSQSGAAEDGWGETVSSWTCLFDEKYRKQTMIGIMVMFFQREFNIWPCSYA